MNDGRFGHVDQQGAPAPHYPADGSLGGPGYDRGPQSDKVNAFAIGSFVCALATFVTAVGFIPGIILGHMALNQIKESGESGAGLAKAGLVISYIFLALGLFFILLFIFAFALFL